MIYPMEISQFLHIKSLINDKFPVNVPLYITGHLAGYTVLHLACIYYDEELIKLLVNDYHADVNAIGDDGAQPIHLACFQNTDRSVKVLLDAGANVNAVVERDLFLKYVKNEEWCNDFGDKMSLSTFATVHNRSLISEFLIQRNANFEAISPTKVNKTLLMYAIENDSYYIDSLVEKFKDLKLLNVRDEDGFSAIQYLLHPKKFGDFRYNGKYFLVLEGIFTKLNINNLILNGADIDATINGDPDTLLVNMAAYRSHMWILKRLLPEYDYITKSKALYYATLPFGDPQTLLRIDPDENEYHQWELLPKRRRRCIEMILKDLVFRREFGLPVPEEEKNLMDELISTDLDIRDVVENHKKNFIEEKLKKEVIQYGDESITFYDLILRCCNEKKLRLLVKNETLVNAIPECDMRNNYDYYHIQYILQKKINKAIKRVELLDQLTKIEHLRKAIPLPYELILDTIEYLGNQDFEKFIKAFFL